MTTSCTCLLIIQIKTRVVRALKVTTQTRSAFVSTSWSSGAKHHIEPDLFLPITRNLTTATFTVQGCQRTHNLVISHIIHWHTHVLTFFPYIVAIIIFKCRPHQGINPLKGCNGQISPDVQQHFEYPIFTTTTTTTITTTTTGVYTTS